MHFLCVLCYTYTICVTLQVQHYSSSSSCLSFTLKIYYASKVHFHFSWMNCLKLSWDLIALCLQAEKKKKASLNSTILNSGLVSNFQSSSRFQVLLNTQKVFQMVSHLTAKLSDGEISRIVQCMMVGIKVLCVNVGFMTHFAFAICASVR